jgi:hypothetical protein
VTTRWGGTFHKRVTAPQPLEPRPRAAHFFRKNAQKTNEATSPKGFTSMPGVPQKSMKLRKNTSKNESKGFVRGAYVEMLDSAKFRNRSALGWCAPSGEARPDCGILVTNPYEIPSYLGNGDPTTTTNARTRVPAQQKYPKNRIRSLSPTGYVEVGSAVKIKTRAAKIPEKRSKGLSEKWVMSNSDSAVKMPKSHVRQQKDFDGRS